MDEILENVARHNKISIIEKVSGGEMAVNFVLESVLGTSANADFPNKYSVVDESGNQIFFAFETTSVLESSIGFNYGLDMVYTAGGQNQPFRKMRGNTLETTVADASSDAVTGEVWANKDSWCCCVKAWTPTCCHESCLEAMYK